jgi:hypothetical protein
MMGQNRVMKTHISVEVCEKFPYDGNKGGVLWMSYNNMDG